MKDLLCAVGQRWGSTFYLGDGVMEERRAFQTEGVGYADFKRPGGVWWCCLCSGITSRRGHPRG